MKEHNLLIDASRCIGCGMCLRDCPENNLVLREKKAVPVEQKCTKCGHCVAICPTSAVSMTGFSEPPTELPNLPRVDPQQLLKSLKSRRSIRQFQDKPVPSEIIEQIIEAGRWTPTAKNAQDLTYLVLTGDKERFEAPAVRFFKRLLPLARIGFPAAKRVSIDDNFFFKKAPVAIVICTKDKVSGSLAASNMALMAEACGLGVLYSGFFTIAANYSTAVRQALGRGWPSAVTTLVLGYSNVTYHRTVQKEPADVKYL